MANDFYDPGEQRAAKVNALFTRIAPRYDLINDLQSFGLHRHWKGKVVEMAQATRGTRALDVCCGTGDLALALARKGAEVTGLDFSQRMLELARRKAERQETENRKQNTECQACRPQFVLGDAQQIPFPANSFDVVTVGYGLRNLADWEAGVREMQRVAKPGGRLLVLDFGKPENPLWRSAYFAYLRMFVPVLGRVFCGSASAYAYILESLRHYPAQHGVAAKMRELGLSQVRIVHLLGGVMTINYGEKAR